MIGIEIKEKFSLMTLEGDLGEWDIAELGDAMDNLIKKGYRHMVLDLSRVSFMGANVLGALLNHWGQIRFRKGDLKIVGLSSRLMNLFKSMGAEKAFEIYADVNEMMLKTGRMPVYAPAQEDL